jgi:hypothetical protein
MSAIEPAFTAEELRRVFLSDIIYWFAYAGKMLEEDILVFEK